MDVTFTFANGTAVTIDPPTDVERRELVDVAKWLFATPSHPEYLEVVRFTELMHDRLTDVPRAKLRELRELNEDNKMSGKRGCVLTYTERA